MSEKRHCDFSVIRNAKAFVLLRMQARGSAVSDRAAWRGSASREIQSDALALEAAVSRLGSPAKQLAQAVPAKMLALAATAGLGQTGAVALLGHSDEALIYSAARGDRSALGELYDRFAPRLLALGRRMLRDPREAEDLLHDVFVDAWKHAGDFDPSRGSAKSWLILRMRSRCLDRLRSLATKRLEPLTSQHDGLVPIHDASAPDAGRLSAALATLSSEQYRVLELGYFHGMSSQEIAVNLGIPVGTVKSRVAAAMGQLRSKLCPQQAEELGA